MNKIHTTLLGLLILLPLTSCLTDTAWEEGRYGLRIEDLETKKIIEVKGMTTDKNLSVLTDEATKEAELFTVHLAAKEVAQEDIVVSLKLSSPEAGVLPLETSEIEIPASVTIKKGERDAVVKAKIKTASLGAEPRTTTVLINGVAQSGYTISGNFGSMTLRVLERSVYEGTYRYEIVKNTIWPKYGGYIQQGAEDYHLSTINKTTVRGIFLYGVFNDLADFTFDPVTHVVKSLSVVGWAEFPLTDSTYDAGTKTWQFTAHHPKRNESILTFKLTRLD